MATRNILKWYLVAASIYLIIDGLIHVFNIKLVDAIGWPQPAFVYAKLIGNFYGGMTILAGLFGIEASRNLEKYRNFLSITAIWALFYASHLLYSGLVIDFVGIFSGSQSIYFWIPFYNYYLLFEAVLLIIFVLLVFIYRKFND